MTITSLEATEPLLRGESPGLSRIHGFRIFRFHPGAEAVACGCKPVGSRRLTLHERTVCEEEIVAALVHHPALSSGDEPGVPTDLSPPVRIVRDVLGRPVRLLTSADRRSVSFARAGGFMWAAAGDGPSDVGIDAAEPREFPGSYPFGRAFVYGEIESVSAGLPGMDFSQAAALIWSVKEASVKALGCGFHFFGPREVRTVVLKMHGDFVESHATISEKAAQRIPGDRTRTLRIRSFRHDTLWVSVALLQTPE